MATIVKKVIQFISGGKSLNKTNSRVLGRVIVFSFLAIVLTSSFILIEYRSLSQQTQNMISASNIYHIDFSEKVVNESLILTPDILIKNNIEVNDLSVQWVVTNLTGDILSSKPGNLVSDITIDKSNFPKEIKVTLKVLFGSKELNSISKSISL